MKRFRWWLRGRWFDFQYRGVPRGYCCCGDRMDNHDNPMNCGHSPVDEYDYYRTDYVHRKDKNHVSTLGLLAGVFRRVSNRNLRAGAQCERPSPVSKYHEEF